MVIDIWFLIIAIIFLFDQKHIGEFLGIPCNRVNVRVKRIGKSNVEIPNKVICDCIFFFGCMLPWIFNRIMIETYQIICVCAIFRWCVWWKGYWYCSTNWHCIRCRMEVSIKFSLSERIFYFVYFVYTINSETMYKRLLINGSKIAANFSPMSTLILHVWKLTGVLWKY